ncbi:MAG: sugar isomerase [Candidatus Glassbacteria bacterium]|nr:sugar isomerase [Candidatus Glassbacteria bacterium]
MGSALRVKPVLVYSLYKKREAWSWRPWGGLHSKGDVDSEAARIAAELKELSARADFPVEIMPVDRVDSQATAAAAAGSDCDVILIFAASGEGKWLETLAAAGKPGIMFLRHRSGPVYLWYEIAHPRFLRKTTDEYLEPNMDVWDIVVDDYDEVLWRLRSLCGLKNATGTRIVAVGGAGGWGAGHESGPATAGDIWKMEIIPVPYEELEPLLKKALGDRARVADAGARADRYLAQPGVSLHTDRKFVVNAFLLAGVFRDLMERADATAVTVQGCMGTIIPIAQTTACLSLSLINDEGLMAFCESDFVVIPSGVLLRHISGKPSFLQDPTHPHDGVVTCAHCTAPRRMDGTDCEPVKILTHFESDYGAAPKVEMRKGQVITNLAPGFSSQKWIGFRGKILDHPFYDICRSQIDIEIEGDWRTLLEDMQGFHWMICYGDYLREVGYALKKVGIQWQDITSGARG